MKNKPFILTLLLFLFLLPISYAAISFNSGTVGFSCGICEDTFVNRAGDSMTGDLTFNNASIQNANYLQFNTTFTDGQNEGRLQWNMEDGTLEVGLSGGVVNLQIGQESLIKAKASEDISNGELVYIDGADGANPTVSLAQANSESIAHKTMGMATEDINSGSMGYITTFGLVRDVNTVSYSAGTELYLSPSVAGAYTDTEPSSPNYDVLIGYVVRQHATEGEILVKIHSDIWETVLEDDYVPYTGAYKNISVNSNSINEINKLVANDTDLDLYVETVVGETLIAEFQSGTSNVYSNMYLDAGQLTMGAGQVNLEAQSSGSDWSIIGGAGGYLSILENGGYAGSTMYIGDISSDASYYFNYDNGGDNFWGGFSGNNGFGDYRFYMNNLASSFRVIPDDGGTEGIRFNLGGAPQFLINVGGGTSAEFGVFPDYATISNLHFFNNQSVSFGGGSRIQREIEWYFDEGEGVSFSGTNYTIMNFTKTGKGKGVYFDSPETIFEGNITVKENLKVEGTLKSTDGKLEMGSQLDMDGELLYFGTNNYMYESGNILYLVAPNDLLLSGNIDGMGSYSLNNWYEVEAPYIYTDTLSGYSTSEVLMGSDLNLYGYTLYDSLQINLNLGLGQWYLDQVTGDVYQNSGSFLFFGGDGAGNGDGWIEGGVNGANTMSAGVDSTANPTWSIDSSKDLSVHYDLIGLGDGNFSGNVYSKQLTIDGDGSKIIFDNLDIYGYKGSLTQNEIFIGASAGKTTSRTGTGGNLGIGDYTLDALTTGFQNTGIGYSALSGVTEGNRNTGVGAYSLFRVTTGDSNFGFGFGAGQFITTGDKNLAIGTSALSNADTSSTQNVALGADALFTATGTVVINDNVAIGVSAGKFLENGADDNVFVGSGAGALVTTGSENVILGKGAGKTLRSGSTNILIGFEAEPLSVSGSNQITIGNNIYGNHDTAILNLKADNGTLYIGSNNNSYIRYDGTNMIINPKVVGSGGTINQGDLKVDENLTVGGGLDVGGYIFGYNILGGFSIDEEEDGALTATLTSADTLYNITNLNESDVQVGNGTYFTISEADGTITFNSGSDGVYEVYMHGSFMADKVSTIHCAVFKNYDNKTDVSLERRISTINQVGDAGAKNWVRVETNDILNIQCESSSANTEVTVNHLDFTIARASN